MNAVSMWNSMWKAHDKTKQLLLFAIPSKKERTVSGRDDASQHENEPGNRSYKRGQMIGLILGPLLFLLSVLFVNPSDLSQEGRMVLAVTLWVATWWITEAIPIPATSLLPIILLPILNAVPMANVTASYGNPIVFLFLGGFMIALAMEKWDLHKRIALNIISVVGTSTSNIVLGFMIATGFLSMWVSNTAAVMMMIPIGTAITYQVSQALKGSKEDLSAEEEKFSKVLIFAIGYAGTIGGLGTLIGTPPNIILAGIVSELYGIQISFGGWMLFAVPVVILLLISTWLYLIKVAHPVKIKSIPGGKELIQNEKAALGRMSFEEKAVSVVFVFAAFMWVSQSFLWKGIIPGIDDTMVAITAGVLLFLIPAKRKGGRLLDWNVAKDIPWGILLLFGGGLAIAGGFSATGLAEWLGNQLKVLDGVSFLVMIIVVTTFVLFLTEITSNTATATMILPVLASLAMAINVHPYAIMIPAAMAANCAFMLPVGTPPNAIIFATGKLKITEMVKNGFWINIFCVILIVGAVYTLVPLLWGVDLHVFPEAFKS
ncbi:DASS family sodium-coupled anion symporter [Rossellomorea marisflavi]|uniref:Sodium-dependent dicarboxylate transporter SdcS n=1 Tax=Rossellomorea marisflavi TaxID=189381 RepID=A0A5D4RRX2_9BACI|nr:DASS family sodium-coupled anion symporter [Rossellomorea marisflavi]TYS52568.1 DASS family sodium-coupled anion symporter [Rossellomorea marisflavi]